MSIEVVGWVLRQDVGNPTRKLVLLGVANHAHPDGTGAWPSVDTIATYAGCTRRSVQRHLRDLEADGWLRRSQVQPVHLRSDRRPIAYDVVTRRGDSSDTPTDENEATPETQRGDSTGSTGRQPAPSRGDSGVALTILEPSGEPSREPSTSAASSRDDAAAVDVGPVFEQWWQRMPRRNGKRVGKGEAREVWRKLSPEQRQRAFEAAQHYRESCDRGDTIAKDPVRFLRRDYFEDWLEPATPAQPTSRAQQQQSGYHDAFSRLAAREGRAVGDA